MRIDLHPGFILHHHPYRETSVLLDFFTQEYGRISLIAKGIRQKKTRLRAILQPFTSLLVSWQGRSELMTLISVEAQGSPITLKAEGLLSAFYLNELLSRVLQKSDPHPHLYTIYHQTLLKLQGPILQPKVLRLFEKKLLEELGYGLQLQYDFSTGELISADRSYAYYPEHGFTQVNDNLSFSGKSLLALHAEYLEEASVLEEIKRLMRIAISNILGQKPLHSRKLFHSSIKKADGKH